MEKLLLTGEPHVGKSTIIHKLQEQFSSHLIGIVAREITDDGTRVGYSSGPLDNPTLFTIAHVDNPSTSRVSRYGIDVANLDSIADLLASQLKEAETYNLILLFDEIGLMQSCSQKLRKQIELALKSNSPTIMTIRQDDSESDWLRELKQLPNVRIITLTPEARDQTFEGLSRYIEANSRHNL
jgi:nucleoside-triphosphatase